MFSRAVFCIVEPEANTNFHRAESFFPLRFAEREQEEEEAREGREIFQKEGLQVLDGAVLLPFLLRFPGGCFHFFL